MIGFARRIYAEYKVTGLQLLPRLRLYIVSVKTVCGRVKTLFFYTRFIHCLCDKPRAVKRLNILVAHLGALLEQSFCGLLVRA